MTDEQILRDLDQNRSSQTPGLNDGFFEDVWDGISETVNDVWDSVSGRAKENAKSMVNKKIDEMTGYDNNQVSYQDQTQYQGPPAPNNQQGEKNIIEKIPPVAVGAGAAAIAKFGAKFGWVTSLAIGGATGAAKYYLIDKKKGANNG